MSTVPSPIPSPNKSNFEVFIEMLRKEQAMKNELPKIEKIVENVFSHMIEVDDKTLISGKIPPLNLELNKLVEIDKSEIPLYNIIFLCLNDMLISHFKNGFYSNEMNEKTKIILDAGIGSSNLKDYISKIFFEELRARNLVPNNSTKVFSLVSISKEKDNSPSNQPRGSSIESSETSLNSKTRGGN